jgi:hypothetical protein
MASPVRTPEEIEALKRNWLSDPCWDIEHTDGFEAHQEELAAFRNDWQAKWDAKYEAQRKEKLATLTARYCCSAEAAEAIDELLTRVRDLEFEIRSLRGRS